VSQLFSLKTTFGKSLPKSFPVVALFIALTSGILMGLTPAPTNLWGLAWVALAPLWVMVVGRAEGSPSKVNLWIPFVWGVAYHGLALSWIWGLHPLTWMGLSWGTSVAITGFAWVFITLWGAALGMTWARLFGFILKRTLRGTHQGSLQNRQGSVSLPFTRVLLGTALWCALSILWNSGPLDWTSLSFTQSPYNLAVLHLGQISGSTAVTGAIVAVNGLIAEAWLYRRQSHDRQSHDRRFWLSISPIVLFGALHLIGLALYSQPLTESPAAALKVGIVQGNIPTRIKLFEEGTKLSLDRYTHGYQTLADQGVDLVLTPEGALPWLWLGRPGQRQNAFYQAILNRGVPAVVGTVGTRVGKITQTLFSVTGSGAIVGRYDKIKLVPLGEYIPFESFLGKFIDRLSPVGASMLPGDVSQHFDTPFGRAIAAICYESAFPWIFRNQAAAGGQFIITASNNDPYSATMMSQHHAQDIMRAIESDRWAVRATNTGFSGIVDPHGKTQWLSGFRTYETHAHIIYRRQTQTLYVRWGDWLLPVLLVTALVSLGMEIRRA
jgi:apolipoprotein N-acyltransferase